MAEIDCSLSHLGDPLPASPLATLGRWFAEAKACPEIRNADAMALASVDAAGGPQVRMVLCRRFDEEQGRFSFYTNRDSPKAAEFEHTPRASAVFYWDALGRQARISGPIARTSDADSNAYFASRPPRSQIAAWTSAQSRPISSRRALLEEYERTARSFEGLEGSIPRPPHWGGYAIEAQRVELWVEGAGRLHDRAVWIRHPDETTWHADRLQP